jgi:hypothetical protein
MWCYKPGKSKAALLAVIDYEMGELEAIDTLLWFRHILLQITIFNPIQRAITVWKFNYHIFIEWLSVKCRTNRIEPDRVHSRDRASPRFARTKDSFFSEQPEYRAETHISSLRTALVHSPIACSWFVSRCGSNFSIPRIRT